MILQVYWLQLQNHVILLSEADGQSNVHYFIDMCELKGERNSFSEILRHKYIYMLLSIKLSTS